MLRWLQNHPNLLHSVYTGTVASLRVLAPALRAIGFKRLNGIFATGERLTKGPLFDCQMCGQCILHSTGMTCPMTCPKNLRNGPCGGVRANGHCEVKPEMACVWVQAWQRSANMGLHSMEIRSVQPPVNRSLQDTSAWLNTLEGLDRQRPPGWVALDKVTTPVG